MDLDARDRKLLCLLDRNARRPISHLTKHLPISKQAVRQRLLKLGSLGIISSPYAKINPFSFSALWAKLRLKLGARGPEVEKRMLELAGRQREAVSVSFFSGDYDAEVEYWARDANGLKGQVDEFVRWFWGQIRERELILITQSEDFPLRALAPEVKDGKCRVRERERARLDGFDLKILDAVAEKADLSAEEIGKRAGTGAKTTHYRLQRMEREGVISAYRLGINYAKAGLARFDFSIKFGGAGGGDLNGFRRFLEALPETRRVNEALGHYDLEFGVAAGAGRAEEIENEMRGRFHEIISDYTRAELKTFRLVRHFPAGE